MSLQTSDMITKLRLHTGEDSTDLSDNDATLLLNQSYWEILDKFAFREKEQASTFDFEDGTRIYAAPNPFEALRTVAVVDDDDEQHFYLKRMTFEWYEENYNSDSDNEAFPTHYARHGSDFYVWPTPDEDYSGVMYYWTTLDDLSDSQDSEIPQVWGEIIMQGGVWRRFLELGDYVRERELRNIQISLINSTSSIESKEEADSRYSGVEIPTQLTEI